MLPADRARRFSNVGENESSSESVEEMRERTKNRIFSLLEEKGPLRKPQIWEEIKGETTFRSRKHFNHFLWSLHRAKFIRARPSEESNRRFVYHPMYPTKWEIAEKAEEPKLGATSWFELLPDDPKIERLS